MSSTSGCGQRSLPRVRGLPLGAPPRPSGHPCRFWTLRELTGTPEQGACPTALPALGAPRVCVCVGGGSPPPTLRVRTCLERWSDGSRVRAQKRLSGQRVSACLRLLLLWLPVPGPLPPLSPPHSSPPLPPTPPLGPPVGCVRGSLTPPFSAGTNRRARGAGLLLRAHKTRLPALRSRCLWSLLPGAGAGLAGSSSTRR